MRSWYPREYTAYRFNSGNELKEVVAQQAKLLFSEIDLKDERTELVFQLTALLENQLVYLKKEKAGVSLFLLYNP